MLESIAKQLFMGASRELEMDDGPSEYTDRLFKEVHGGSQPAEEKLLLRCAMAAAYASAAYLPPMEAVPEPDKSLPDARAACSENAAQLLKTALTMQCPEIALEWLTLAGPRNTRPPDRLLPALLVMGTQKKFGRQVIRAAAGPLGVWLAGKNRMWAWALVDESESGAPDAKYMDVSAWEEGRLDERCDFLRRLRRDDPARALDLLQTGLDAEKAANRSMLIRVLEHDLSEGDEAFLEARLTDKSLEVKRAVGELLSRLPSSAFSRRMSERLAAAVSLKGKKLIISPPESIDEGMKADGLSGKAAPGMGDKAALLMRITAWTPLSWWRDALNLPLEKILRMVLKTDWARALIEGLDLAACNQRRPDWILALLNLKPSDKIRLDRDGLIRALPQEDLDNWIASEISPKTIMDVSRSFMTDPRVDPETGPLFLSEAASRTVIKAARKAVQLYPSHYVLRDLINALAARIHPGALDAAALDWPEKHDNWTYYGEHLTPFFEKIKLRQGIYQEFA